MSASMADEATSTTAAPAAEENSAVEIPAEPSAGFGERGRMRRRLRFLRKARELAYRDLGGLVFEMQRLGERHDELVAAKLATLTAIDTELRALEHALADRRSATVLRESGIAACPRCAAIHGSEDRFCPACGLAMERHADLPIAGAPAATPAAAPPAATTLPAGPQPTSPQPATSTPASTPPPTPTPPARTEPPVAAPRPEPVPAPRPEPVPAPAPTAPVTDDRPTEIIRPPEQQS
jgi:hypothetical protein